MTDTQRLAALDKNHIWHPFTPMRQWQESDPVIIDQAQGFELIDTLGSRYIDGVSSLWCNVHGHRVPAIDQAVRDQLDKVAHSTLLGLSSTPSIELAAQLVQKARATSPESTQPLNRVFYSDSGATALEVAFKMAVGYWYHKGRPQKHKFIGFQGAYHGDTAAAMSVGYSDLFHRPFLSMVFPTIFAPSTDALRAPDALHYDTMRQSDYQDEPEIWPSENPLLMPMLRNHCLTALEDLLKQHADQTAAIVIEPVMQGAAGMICQPEGFMQGVARLSKKYGVLLIADEVAVGFGRTGTLFACEQEQVSPDILCLAKGITGGYLPLAATLCTQDIFDAFTGELSQRRALYHGHTYTGNALACAAAIASLGLFDSNQVLAHARASARIVEDRLDVLHDPDLFPNVIDVRQRGLMVGIELGKNRQTREPFDFSKRTGARICMAMRPKGLIIRPLGDVVVMMPAPAMPHAMLHRMLDIVIETIKEG